MVDPRHKKELSYKLVKPKLDKYGRDVKSKQDRWSRVNASKFKPPIVPYASLAYRGGPSYAFALEEAARRVRVKQV